MTDKVAPRKVPDRDSKYMGLAWIAASFSKDPSTQCGSFIVDSNNKPLGSGYNGPSSEIDDDEMDWCRPDPDDPVKLSKYDLVIHAEENAVDHSYGKDLTGATLYVTAFPCKDCMRLLVKKRIYRVVYTDFQSDKGSMLRAVSRQKSEAIAKKSKHKVIIEEFNGDLSWLKSWVDRMGSLGLFDKY
jgi:dCMP deaminase